MDASGEDRKIQIGHDLLRSIKRFKHLDLSVLEAEILARLIDGRRTANELVYEIYGTSKKRSGFAADYNRVRRSLKLLQGRGHVTVPLFSKEKPYRLTQHGVASLVRIGAQDWPVPRVVTRKDIALYGSSIGFAIGTVLASVYLEPSSSVATYIAGFFLVSIGGSIVRLLQSLSKVI